MEQQEKSKGIECGFGKPADCQIVAKIAQTKRESVVDNVKKSGDRYGFFEYARTPEYKRRKIKEGNDQRNPQLWRGLG